jgi:hypothetical protein
MRATRSRVFYSREYTNALFSKLCFYMEGGYCFFKVTTGEDHGGLNCRARPSLRSSVVEIVPKGDYVSVIDFTIGKKRRAFFTVVHDDGRTCYMRATQSRLSYYYFETEG